MILSDRDIKKYLAEKKLVIEGLNEENIQAGWVDLTLGNQFRLFKTTAQPYIDVKSPKDYTEKVDIKDDEHFIIHPGEFVLGQISEKIKIPADLAAYVDGRSSLGRIGLVVHVTSGFVDPGFAGYLVLEMTNVGKMPIALHPSMKICKLVFFTLSSPAEKPYFMRKDAKYHGQDGVVGSKIHEEYGK
jgi:dCTP deaminase